MPRRKKGFTLIEVLFVVIVIAVLAAIAIGRITTTTVTAKANACKANQAIMNTQIEQYNLNTGSYPADNVAFLSFLENTDYFPDGPPECPSGGTYSMDTYKRTDCSIESPDHSLHP
ncbi:MAG: prepilin-type N-terminal cleavage/methylation domain-containing protein [Candidatus Omnitrophica bacterium]|nr:prepilin-type N-terminal cleavage/methylation domain-containing protein [Candidatus Omnitrophota bacterium]